jgi:hypothetical protein
MSPLIAKRPSFGKTSMTIFLGRRFFERLTKKRMKGAGWASCFRRYSETTPGLPVA